MVRESCARKARDHYLALGLVFSSDTAKASVEVITIVWPIRTCSNLDRDRLRGAIVSGSFSSSYRPNMTIASALSCGPVIAFAVIYW